MAVQTLVQVGISKMNGVKVDCRGTRDQGSGAPMANAVITFLGTWSAPPQRTNRATNHAGYISHEVAAFKAKRLKELSQLRADDRYFICNSRFIS